MATMGYGSQVLAGANDWWRNTTDPLGPHHPFERSTAKSRCCSYRSTPKRKPPVEITIVEQLPKNAVVKIDKPLLRKSIAQHHQ
jgi:acyl-CoA synthetase (AMP-forming)/AMP-acid ligase II